MNKKRIFYALFMVVCVSVGLIGGLSLANWILSEWDPQVDRLEQWTQTQNLTDAKWEKVIPEAAVTILLTMLGFVVLAWVVLFLNALKPAIGWAVYQRNLGPRFVLPIGILLWGVSCLLAMWFYNTMPRTFGSETMTLGRLGAWITGRYAGDYPRDEIAILFYYGVGPGIFCLLTATSALLYAVMQSHVLAKSKNR